MGLSRRDEGSCRATQRTRPALRTAAAAHGASSTCTPRPAAPGRKQRADTRLGSGRPSRSHTAPLGLASTEPDGCESRAPHTLLSFARVLAACPPEKGAGSSALRHGLLLPPPPAPRDPRGGPTAARRAEPRAHNRSVAMTATPPPLRRKRGALVTSRARQASIGPDEARGRASGTSGSPIGRLAVAACGGGELVSASRVIPVRCGRKQMVSAFPFPYARLAVRGPRRSVSRSLQGAGDGQALTALPPGPQGPHLGSVAGPQHPAAQTCERLCPNGADALRHPISVPNLRTA